MKLDYKLPALAYYGTIRTAQKNDGVIVTHLLSIPHFMPCSQVVIYLLLKHLRGFWLEVNL